MLCIQTILEDADPVHKVTIIGRGPSDGGATFSLPEKDRLRLQPSISRGHDACPVRRSNRRAEEGRRRLFRRRHGHPAWPRFLPRSMVLEWGMSERLGFVNYNRDDSREGLVLDKDHSPETARIIDEEIKRLIDATPTTIPLRLISESTGTRSKPWPRPCLKYETLQSHEVIDLIEGRRVDRPTVSDLLDEESKATSDQTRPHLPRMKVRTMNLLVASSPRLPEQARQQYTF